jgi:ankyrin repeat protein
MSNAGSLHNAARTGDLAELGKFLGEDVDVNATDKHQRTALHLAAWAGHVVRC